MCRPKTGDGLIGVYEFDEIFYGTLAGGSDKAAEYLSAHRSFCRKMVAVSLKSPGPGENKGMVNDYLMLL